MCSIIDHVAQQLVYHAKTHKNPKERLVSLMHDGMNRRELAAYVLAIRYFDPDFKFYHLLVGKKQEQEHVKPEKDVLKPVQRVEVSQGRYAPKNWKSAFSRSEIAKEGPQSVLVRTTVECTQYSSKGKKKTDHGYYTKDRWSPKPGFKSPVVKRYGTR